jgi:DNA (cytosine-5)-methyltransferase 1
MRTFGLFAGIGGIEKGLEAAGHQTVALCEIDEGAGSVLEKHFPGVPVHRDICELASIPRRIDLIAAGFPCQDLSQAGQTAGITGSRSGLVGHVFRLLADRRVPWVLIENVPFMLQLGRGRALEVIVEQLERLGYRWAYRVVDTLAFGLPQRRERVFLLASRRGDPRTVLLADDAGTPTPRTAARKRALGFYWTEGVRGLGTAIDAVPTLKGGSAIGIPSPPAIVLPSGRVVTPDIRDAERLQGFEPDWTLPARSGGRRDGHRWKLVGNAVTVDVARWIGLRLRSPGTYDSSWDRRLSKGDPWPNAAWSDGVRRSASATSTWPVAFARQPIDRFLRFEKRDLSTRATAGFLGRLRSSSLRRPPWFERALENHLERMTSRGR